MSLSNLYIGAYNIRSYPTHASEFHSEAKKIDFHIIGLTEVKKRGNGWIDLKNGATLYYSGHADKGIGGVGFYSLVKSQVHGFTATSLRIAQLFLRIRNSSHLLQLIQVYAPATSAKDPTDAAYDTFIGDLSSTLKPRLYFGVCMRCGAVRLEGKVP